MPTLATLNRRLLQGAADGDPTSVRNALMQGADINVQNHKGDTALLITASNGNLDVLKELLSHNPDLEATDINGKTSLHRSMYAKTSAYALLIQAGASVHACDDATHTPLIYAVHRPDAVRHLLEAGADPNHSAGGASPLSKVVDSRPIKHLTDVQKDEFLSPYLQSLDILIQCGADVNQKDGFTRSPLSCALTNQVPWSFVEKLLDAGADLAAGMAGNTTALDPIVAICLERRCLQAFANTLTSPILPSIPRSRL